MRSTDSRHRTGALVERVRQSTLMAAYNARAGLRSWGMWGKPIASVHCVGISVGISSIYLREFHLKNNGDQFTSSHHLKSTDVRRRPWIFYFLLYFQYLSLRLSKTNPPMYLHQRIYYRS